MNSNIETTTSPSGTGSRSQFAQACRTSCRKLLGQIKRIKAGIVAEFRGRLDQDQHLLELAVNEAEALAWQSGFPQLLFPALAAEKAQSAAQWHARQQRIRGERNRLSVVT